MEENIEVKDVQKTEYLDKNGLDMLWAKIKENAHNQVEVEYNRAKAKEDSLSQEIASVKPDEGKSYIQAKLTSKEQDGDSCSYDVAGNISFKSEYSDSYSGPITQIDKNGIDINFDNDPTFGSTGSLKVKMNNDYNITMQGNGRLLHDTKDTFNQVSISLLDNVDTTYANSSSGNSMLISQLGIFYTSQSYALTSNDLLTGHGSYKTIGTDIAPLENGKVPEKYLDLPQIDTSDFVSKTTTDEQIINSALYVAGGEITLIQSMDNTDINATLATSGLEFNGIDRSAIELNSISLDGQSRSKITIETNNENPNIILGNAPINDTLQRALTITNEGISNTDNNANHVYATDGSIADLTQYAKKSEITTGGNVDDVQVNGVSAVENKIANIKPATKENLGVVKVGDGLNVTDGTISVDTTAIGAGNYIPYDETDADSYKVNKPLVVTSDTTLARYSSEDIMSYAKESGVIRNFRLDHNTVEGQNNNKRYTISSENGIDIVKPGLEIIASYDGFYTVSSSGGSFYNPVSLTKNRLAFGKEGKQVSIDLAGIKFYGRSSNEVPNANGGFINISNYVQKPELPTVPTKVSQLQNDSEFITKSVYDEKIAALEARIAVLEAKHTETA